MEFAVIGGAHDVLRGHMFFPSLGVLAGGGIGRGFPPCHLQETPSQPSPGECAEGGSGAQHRFCGCSFDNFAVQRLGETRGVCIRIRILFR